MQFVLSIVWTDFFLEDIMISHEVEIFGNNTTFAGNDFLQTNGGHVYEH